MLEKFFQISVQEIAESELNSLDSLPYGQDYLYRINETFTYQNSFTNRHNFVKPGVSDANIFALFYEIVVSNDAHLEYQKLSNIILDFFKMDFGGDNLLYATSEKRSNEVTFYLLTYPLPKRTLDPRPWTFKGKMVSAKSQRFFHYIETKFELKEEVTEENKYILDDERALEDLEEKEYITMINSSAQTDMPYEDIMNIFRITYRYFASVEKHAFNEARKHHMEPKQFLGMIENYLKRNYSNLTKKDIKFLLDEMYNAIYDYYVLTPLINDPNIGDIKVLNTNQIRVKVHGERMTSNLKFDSAEDYENFIDGITYRNNIDINENDMTHFVDTEGNPYFRLRFNISTTYVATNPVSYMHIRKISKIKPSINQLIKDNMLTKELALWLIKQAKYAKGIIFVGAGGSGKTTLMNVLLEYIPYTKSGMIIQDNEELFTDKHPDLMFLHTVESKGVHDNNRTYDLKDISKNGLLVDIDYFVIGEIKGGEAMYFLNASATGATCWASLHSSKPRLDKLADYVMYDSKYDRKQALMMLQNLEYVVYMEKYRVKEIARVNGWNDKLEDIEYEEVYNCNVGFINKEKKGA